MASPATSARVAVKAALIEALGGGFPVLDDRLHESLGADGAIAGTSPEEERASGSNANVLEIDIFVQVYMSWDKQIDNTQTVDPAAIEALADAFRVAMRSRVSQGSSYLWYLTVDRIVYPKDPTGNKTRFEAYVRARAENNALVETGP